MLPEALILARVSLACAMAPLLAANAVSANANTCFFMQKTPEGD
jgi:hypothetical protein